MQSWDLTGIDVEPHQPEVLTSASEGRAIAIQLPAGEALDEHQVHERAWLVVVDGSIELVDPDGNILARDELLGHEHDDDDDPDAREHGANPPNPEAEE
jgi:hypothetical protein